MARVTVEDCLRRENNRFALVRLATLRAKQLLSGKTPLVESKNKAVVAALREIAGGKVKFRLEEDEPEQSFDAAHLEVNGTLDSEADAPTS